MTKYNGIFPRYAMMSPQEKHVQQGMGSAFALKNLTSFNQVPLSKKILSEGQTFAIHGTAGKVEWAL